MWKTEQNGGRGILDIDPGTDDEDEDLSFDPDGYDDDDSSDDTYYDNPSDDDESSSDEDEEEDEDELTHEGTVEGGRSDGGTRSDASEKKLKDPISNYPGGPGEKPVTGPIVAAVFSTAGIILLLWVSISDFSLYILLNIFYNRFYILAGRRGEASNRILVVVLLDVKDVIV